MDDDTWHLQVGVTYCVTGLRANCDLRVSGEVNSYWREHHYWILLTNKIQVRACHGDTSAQEVSSGDSVYYVYRLVSVPTACQWGYCAYTNYNGPSWRICYKYFVFHVSSQPQYNQCNVTSSSDNLLVSVRQRRLSWKTAHMNWKSSFVGNSK